MTITEHKFHWFSPSLVQDSLVKKMFIYVSAKNPVHDHPKVPPQKMMKVKLVILPNMARIPKVVVRVKMNTQVRQQYLDGI